VDQIEQLLGKKRTVLGTINSSRRELEDVRAELAKLKLKETELLAMLEKRELAVQQIGSQIEELEQLESKEKLNAEDSKKKWEEERARRVREENESRKREEEEVDRQRREAEEERRRQTVVNSPKYVDIAAVTRGPSTTSVRSTAPVETTPTSLTAVDDGLNPEEARLMRAMSRKGLLSPGRGPSYKPSIGQLPEQKSSPKIPTAEPAWKGQERQRDIRAFEETKRREEEKRAIQSREAALLNSAKLADQQRIADIHNREGVQHTFTTPLIYDYDASVSISGDFTDWQEVPITSEISDKFTYSITLPVPRGTHFYRFKVDGKWDVNKNLPTGVGPIGELMNKVDV